MSKDKKLNEFDDLDNMDEFGWGDDDSDFGFEEPKDDRKPITKIASSFLEGVKETATSPSFITKVMRRALPRGYGDALDAAKEIHTGSKELYNKATEKLAPDAREFARAAKKLTPKAQGFLPDSITRSVDKLLDKMSGGDDDYRAPSQAETDGLAVAGEIANIFKTNTEAQLDVERARVGREKARDAVTNGLSRGSITLLTNIATASERLVNYQDEITNKWQRKSLEIQYRHMFLTRDILEVSKSGTVDTINQLKAIAKNSALPDVAKIHLSEQAGMVFRERTIGKVHDGISDFSNKFLSNIFKRVGDTTDDIATQLGSLLGMGGMAADMAGGMGEMEEDPSQGNIAIAKLLASLGGEFAATWGGGKLGDKLKPLFAKSSKIKGLGSKLEYIASNYPQLIADWASTYGTGDDVATNLTNLLKYQFDGFKADKRLGTASLGETAETPAIWDKLQRRTLVEIIPGLLARQLRELQITNGADRNIGLIQYDYDKDGFSTESAVKANIKRKMLNGFTKEHFDQTMNRIEETIFGDESDVSPEVRKALMAKIKTDMLDNKAFNPARYTKHAEGDAVGESVAKVVKSLFGVDEKGRIALDNVDGNALRTNAAREYGWLQHSIANVSRSAIKHNALGQKDLLRSLGVIKENAGGIDEIDYDYIKRYLDGTDNETGPTPDLGPGTPPNPAGGGGGPNRGGGNPPGNLDNPGPAGEGANTSAWLEELKKLVAGLKVGENNALPWFTEDLYNGHHNELLETIKGNRVVDESKRTVELLQKITELLAGGAIINAGGDPSPRDESGPDKVWRWVSGVVGSVGAGAGKALRGIGSLYSTGLGMTLRGAGKLMGVGSDLASWGFHAAMDSDIYIGDDKHPTLLAKGMRAGIYYDQLTGTVIKGIRDITGPVVDSEGNYLITVEDFKRGLRESSGTKVLVDLTTKALRGGLGLAGDFYGTMLRWAGKAIKWTWDKAVSMATDVTEFSDAYVKGESKPRIYAAKLRNGCYFDKLGRVITSLKGFEGDIFDEHGNIVLTAEELAAGLFNRSGEKLDIRIKAAGKYIKGLFTIPMNIMRGAGALYGKGVAALFRAGRSVTDWLLGGLQIQVGNGGILKQIYDLLDERLKKPKNANDLDGDGLRDGSWEEQAKEKSEKKSGSTTDAKKDTAKTESKPGWLGGLLTSLGVGADGKNAGDDEDDASGVADELLDELGEGEDSDTDDRRNRRGRRRRPRPRARGFWGKLKRLALSGKDVAVDSAKWIGKKSGKLIGAGGKVALRTAGRYAAGTAAGVLGVMAAPEVAAAVAIATTAWTIYDIYNAFMGKVAGPLAEYRFAQYGIFLDDEERAAKVLALEKMLVDKTTCGKEGARISNSFSMFDALHIFATGSDYREDWFYEWYDKRFKPVYLAHCTAMHRATGGNSVDISDIDRNLPKSGYNQFVTLTSFSYKEGCPYFVLGSPFGAGALYVTAKDIEIHAGRLRVIGDTATKELKVVADRTAKIGGDYHKLAAASSAANKPYSYGTQAPAPVSAPADAYKKALGGIDATYVWKAPGVSVGGNVVDFTQLETKRLDPLSIVRLRAHGLVELDSLKVKALIALENAVIPALTIDSEGRAKFTGNADQYYDLYAPAFGCKVDRVNDRVNWSAWFNYRFIPVLVAYVTGIRKRNADASLIDAWHYLESGDSLAIAEEVVSATTDYEGHKVPVWNVPTSPFPDYTLSSSSDVVAGNLNLLKNNVGKRVIEDQFAKLRGDAAPVSKMPSSFENLLKVSKDAPSAPSLLRGGNLPIAGANSSWGDTSVAGAKGPWAGGASAEQPLGGGAKGAGWEAMRDTIYKAADMAGVSRGDMAALAGIESTYNPNAKPNDGSTSAKGLYQFVDETWRATLAAHASKYGLSPTASVYDPLANALMGAEYIKSNTASFQQRFGFKPSATDIYMMHLLGPGKSDGSNGAAKFISSLMLTPNAVAANDFPTAARNNSGAFYDKAGVARTYAEVYRFYQNKVAQYTPTDTGTPTPTVEVNDSVAAVIPSGDSDPNVVGMGQMGQVSQEELAAASKASAAIAAVQSARKATQAPSALAKRVQSTGAVAAPTSKATSGGGVAAPYAAAAASFANRPAAGQFSVEPAVVEQKTRANVESARQVTVQQETATGATDDILRSVDSTLKSTLEVSRSMDRRLGDIHTAINGLKGSGIGEKVPPMPKPRNNVTPPVNLKVG